MHSCVATLKKDINDKKIVFKYFQLTGLLIKTISLTKLRERGAIIFLLPWLFFYHGLFKKF